ncbi:MAG: ATP-dependent helicase HrpB [Fibrobacteres bacterium]|nr:ATP-dependent helicase HrpB [Fibrobacterota bacterium]
MIKNSTIDQLPIYDVAEDFIKKFSENNRIVLKAPTGSGKSTQIPQIILKNFKTEGKILVLEPRRIAARMVAHRVAKELGQNLGEEIGFITRYEQAVSSATKVFFITEGILPRRLLSDSLLGDVSVVIFDEFHERSLTTDLGLALIKRIQDNERPELNVVVMSATLDTGPLSEFLTGASIVESMGSMYPVDVRYSSVSRDNPPWESALSGVRTLLRETDAGDILVFQPGAFEIRKTVDTIRNANLNQRLTVLPLYGDLPFEQQQKALSATDDRKIIVATNIAETSLTIPGVRHVVDTGLARINRYDNGKGFNLLYTESISQASADQRAGRAGREAPGICIRLWSAASHSERARNSEAEVGRVDLAESALNLHMLGVPDISLFGWYEKPPQSSIKSAEELLSKLGAINVDGTVTDKGALLSKIPAHPRLSVLMLEAARNGVTEKGTLAVALLTERTPFVGKADIYDASDLKESGSDFELYEKLLIRAAESDFSPQVCNRLGINAGAARQVLRTQNYYANVIERFKVESRSMTDESEGLSKAVLAAYPDRLARFRDNGTLQYVFEGGKSGELAPSSAARGATLLVAGDVREMRFRGQNSVKTILSMACAVTEEWLLELFPDNWESAVKTEWHNERMAVERRTQTYCLGVLIEDKLTGEPDPEAAAQLLASIICERNLKLDGWDDETEKLIERVSFARELMPDSDFPDWSIDNRRSVVELLCQNEKKYSAVRSKEIAPFLKGILGNSNTNLDKIAPPFISMPNNRKMVIRYEKGKPPCGRARIQDIYDLRELPIVGNGKVKMIIEILAPNQRAVQVTDDLSGFWKNHYPELKKTLSRRYPRHEWR